MEPEPDPDRVPEPRLPHPAADEPAARHQPGLHQPTAESSHTQVYGSGNAVDGDKNTYWESTNNAFPRWWPVDLGSATSAGRLVLDLPPSSAWGTRNQTSTVSGSTDGSNVTTLKASAGYTPDPSTGNTATGTFPAATVRYLRLTFTTNTGWPVGQLSEREAYAS
ncbi:discoidin domain-containing protein [Streptomyces sp. NPDC054933]